jgi:hypothetical protein
MPTTNINLTIDKTTVGLANVDNTSDSNKPVSTATQTALNLKLDISATTAGLADSSNKRYVTDADLVKLGNTSGTNTGDQDLSGYELLSNKSTSVTTDQASDTKYPSVKSVYDWATSVFQTILTETTFGSFINGLAAKTTPVDADSINIVDSADSNKAKKVSFTNVKAFLKTYFDSIYEPKASQSAIAASAIDWTYTHLYKTLSANTTFTFSNAADAKTIIIAITGASTYTVTWPAGVKWTGGTEPTQSLSNTDIYTLVQINGVIYGSYVQNLS